MKGVGGQVARFTHARNSDELASSLRAYSVAHKFFPADAKRRELTDVLLIAADLKDYENPRYLSYVAALVLAVPSTATSMHERAYELLQDFLQVGGYASGFDYAKTITIRRRSWLLGLMVQESLSEARLRADLDLWRSILVSVITV